MKLKYILLFTILVPAISQANCKSEPNGFQCIFDLYMQTIPGEYRGQLSTFIPKYDGIDNDASRIAGVLNDCNRKSCWMSVDATRGSYIKEVIERAVALQKILLLGSMNNVNIIFITNKRNSEEYVNLEKRYGFSAKVMKHPYL